LADPKLKPSHASKLASKLRPLDPGIIIFSAASFYKMSPLTGCRYKLLVILLYKSPGLSYNTTIDRRFLMEDIKSPSSVTLGELTRIVKEFEEKIQNGTENPDRFLTLSEVEELWGKLIGETNVIYSDMLHDLIQNISEKELIRRKKENSKPKE
jgi:hypothetical protein